MKKYLNAKNNTPINSMSTHYVLISIDYFIRFYQNIKLKLLLLLFYFIDVKTEVQSAKLSMVTHLKNGTILNQI